jgi:hypothetical protein
VGAALEGKSQKQIAAAEGVDVRTVRRDLAEPQARYLLSSLCAEHAEELRRLFTRSLKALDEALDATTSVQIGEETREVPDHRSRLAAVQRLTRLLQAGAAVSRGGEDSERRPGWTWEEFAQVYVEMSKRTTVTKH